jgi:hypothetical protein
LKIFKNETNIWKCWNPEKIKMEIGAGSEHRSAIEHMPSMYRALGFIHNTKNNKKSDTNRPHNE